MGDSLWMNASAGAPSYTASELRRAFAALLAAKGTAGTNRFGAVEGVRPGGGVITSLSGSTITVQEHAGVISPDLSGTQGPYVYQLGADETHTLTAAHATLARDDLVYIQVSDHDEDGSGARQVVSGYLAGTAGSGLPALPARSFEIARIAVPASGGGSPVLTERGRYTVASGGILPVRDTADLPAHHEGRAAVLLDTDRLVVSDGSAWQRVGHYSASGRTGCRVRRVAVQGIGSGSATAIIWDTEDHDSDGFISVASPHVTIPAGLGGLYAITAWASGAFTAGRAFIDIAMTSTLTGLPAEFRMPMDANEDRGLLSVTIPLLAGDVFQTRLFHSTGSGVDFTAWLSCVRVAI
jgi:hypothetical protein